MKKQQIFSLGGTLSHGELATEGLHFLQSNLGVTHNTEDDMRQAVDLAQKICDEFQATTVATSSAIAARKAAYAKAGTYLTVLRELLKPTLGSRYNTAWNPVGFYNRTLAIPENTNLRLNLVKASQGYLEAHPEAVVEEKATPAIASAIFQELAEATTAASIAKSTQRQKKVARNAAIKGLRKSLQNLFGELKQLMPANDPRWLDFGFNVPADLSVPEAPAVFTVVPGTAGYVFASWEMPTGATRIRLFQQVVGVDEKFVRIDTLKDSSKYIGGLTSGAHVKFYITAANAAGESLPSATVEIVVP